jgi:glycosyltransferase involved in cell wall biosynthesis
MKILHISNHAEGGGAETVFHITSQIPSHQNFLGYVRTDESDGKPHVSFTSWEHDNRLKGVINYIFSFHNYRILYEYLVQTPVDVIHLHGFFSVLSPSILLAVKNYKRRHNVRVIQTLHDFHLVCPNSSLFNFTTQTICEKCVGHNFKFPIFLNNCDRRGYFHSCIKGIRSFFSSNIIGHRDVVDFFICPSIFLKTKLQEDGIPENKIGIIRNPVSFRTGEISPVKKNIVSYFGRFSIEKDLCFLISAFTEWKERTKNDFQLLLIGQGEEETRLKDLASRSSASDSIMFREFVPHEKLCALLREAKYFSLTSKCYENSPMTIIESIALNIIPIAPNIGGMHESITSLTGVGRVYQIHNIESWIQAVESLEHSYEAEFATLIQRKKVLFKEIGTATYYASLTKVYSA